jgi:enoyl-CoA hydratase
MTALRLSTPVPAGLLITLQRPHRRNALDSALLRDLAAALSRAAADDAVRCVVITGDDRAFSSGADIHEMREGGLAVLQHPQRLDSWAAIERFPKPLIAAVNGFALGGGNELVLLCDIAIAGETASFGQPEVQLGGMPGDGGTQRLIRAVGKAVAMQMILTGKPIGARTALAIGLVAEVTPTERTIARGIEIAQEIAAASPHAVQAAKKAVLQAFELPLAEGLCYERRAMWALAATPERAAGLAAFADKADSVSSSHSPTRRRTRRTRK